MPRPRKKGVAKNFVVPIWLSPDCKDEFGLPLSLSLLERTPEEVANRARLVEEVMVRLFKAADDQLGPELAHHVWAKVGRRKTVGKHGQRRSRAPEKDTRILRAYDLAASLANSESSTFIPSLAETLYREDSRLFGPSVTTLKTYIRRLVAARAARPVTFASSEPSLLELASTDEKTK